jgi:hypothetical protein
MSRLLKIFRCLDLDVAGEALAVVREEPPLDSFGPVLAGVGRRVVLAATH